MSANATNQDVLLKYSVAVVMAASAVLVLRGWLHADMVAKIAWTSDGMLRLAAVSAAFWLLFVASAWADQRRLVPRLLGIATIVIAALAGVVPVIAVGLLLFAAAAIGGSSPRTSSGDG